MPEEEVFSDFGVEQIHTVLIVCMNSIDDGDVVFNLITHYVEVVEFLLKNFSFKIVCAVSISVVDERDEQILFDKVNIEVCKLLFGVACDRIANVRYSVVFIDADNVFSRIYFGCFICKHGYIRTFFEVELFDVLEVDIESDVAVGDDDVFLFIV
ncbi:unknown [Acidaminococcus sp. CAG:917]|nr:unknown [Acidaminococcus sp. CAG:917]